MFFAGVLGLAGVAAAAAGAHVSGGAGSLPAAALICLTHAPALLALALLARRGRVLRLAGWLLFAGAALFSADIALRALGYGRLFAMAAPSGGVIMMVGWIVVALAALMPARQDAG